MIKSLSFCFKGGRTYVHGTDIVLKLLEVMSNCNLSNIDIKFNNVANTCLDLVEGQREKGAKVNIRWLEDGELKFYQLIENGRPIECRKDYDEGKIINCSQIDLKNKSIKLEEKTDYTLYENIVAMNKHLLQSIYPDEIGKWYFTRLEQSHIVSANSVTEVRLIKNFNFRLTKSEFLVGGRVVGNIYFSLVRGQK